MNNDIREHHFRRVRLAFVCVMEGQETVCGKLWYKQQAETIKTQSGAEGLSGWKTAGRLDGQRGRARRVRNDVLT